ncbi:serine hydrolase domain-containing protein [Sediminibacterium ginsengisoli]|nr:serine hydrolase domain-containing protein [Sediminibacterium ginsengisoli]
MKLSRLFLFVILAGFACAAAAQNNFSDVDRWLSAQTGNMGGRSLLVVYKDGKLIYTKAVNDMRAGQKLINRAIARRQGKEANTEDYTPDTRQPIASCSKWLSAALVMTFIDEGKLSLSDTVGRFLPVLTQNGKGNITISQCLSHMTGIKAAELKDELQDMRGMTSMDDAVRRIAMLPMEGTPGKVFHYSNTGLQLAGAVIEKISGKSFEQLFTERIAVPLGMTGTDFGKGPVALPAGGAISTPNDYIRFLEMILHKGMFRGKRILSEKAVADMQVNRITGDVKVAYAPAEAGNFGYGFGEWVMDNISPSNAVTSPGLFGSFPWIDNERGYAGFLMTYYIKNDGRNQRYKQLKQLVDKAVK